MELNVSKIFIIHYKKLVERKDFIIDQFNKNFIDMSKVEWVTHYDKDEWNLDEIKCQHAHMFDGSGIHCKLIRNVLNYPEISLDLKHQYIICKIVRHQIQDALIFEDDCIIQPNSIERFNSYKLQLPKHWHTLFTGSDGQQSKNIVPGVNIYERKGFHSSRGTFSYLVSLEGAILMKNMILKINDPPDWYFNYMIKTLGLNNYWAEPPLVLHNYNFQSVLHEDQKAYYANCPPEVISKGRDNIPD